MDIEDIDRKSTTFTEYLQSARESTSVLVWTWRTLQTPEQFYWFKRMVGFLILSSLSQAMIPYMISFIVNGLTVRSVNIIVFGITGSAMMYVVQKFAHYKQARSRESIVATLQGTLDDFITKKLFEKSLGQHAQHSSSLSAANMEKGRSGLIDLQKLLMFDGFNVLVTLLISYSLLWFLSPVSGAVITVGFSVYFLWTMFLNHQVVVVCGSIDKKHRKLNRHRLERWEKIERVKTSSKANEEFQNMSDDHKALMAEDRKFWFWFIKHNNLRDIVMLTAFVLIMCYGSFQVYNGLWMVGALYPIFAWVNTVVANVWQVGRIEHQINWNMPAIKATIEALSIPPDIVPVGNPVAIGDKPVSIEFKDVSYVYPNNVTSEVEGDDEDDVLHAVRNLSFTLEAGTKLAIIGPSGAGKTTVAKLLLRYMDPTSGSIIVNGVNLREIDPNEWSRTYGYIPQHPQVLNGTVRYNLTYALGNAGAEKVSDDELWSLMRELQIDFGKRLNKGLDTEVGRGGIQLSGGQSQRLIIGAAAIKKPRVMFIDEATSSLDSTTERLVQCGLAKVLTPDVTAVVIAHRLSTVRNLCNTFIVLKSIEGLVDGESQIEAIAGSFEELQQISPTFRTLAADQGLQIA